MLCSKDPIEIEVPHEPGNFFDFLVVPWPSLKRSRKAASHENTEVAALLGGEFAKAMQDDDEEDEEKRARKEERALERLKAHQFDESNFDAAILLEEGLVGWRGPNYPDKCTAKNKARLDERTMLFAKQSVIDITKPLGEEEEKN